MNIALNNNLGFKWFNNNYCFVKGYLYDNANKLYKDEDLINYFCIVENEAEFRNKLIDANGNFAVVLNLNEAVLAAVDRIRSLPLFYSAGSEDFIISDDASYIKEKTYQNRMDDVSVNEFLLTGYVTNEDTLYKSVKQVQAGEYILFNKKLKEIYRSDYFRLQHNDYYDMSSDELISKLDDVHIDIFKRLIQSLDGHTVVVPLSGGYDSRLVVTMLKRLEYKNVICFSYGKPGNLESKISKQVADYLGYKWIFVSYSNDLWYKWFYSKEREAYCKYGSMLTSLAHMQDWPAVMKLKSDNLIPADSILIPGHTGDFIEGGHIPKLYKIKNIVSVEEFIDSIYKKHYYLSDWQSKNNQYSKIFKNKIIKNIKLNNDISNELGASLIEEWEWRERQAKFICNAVRVYEYFGYEWRIPLWDYELIKFWSKIHLEKRYMRKLYKEYDDKYFMEINTQIHRNTEKTLPETIIVTKVLNKIKNNRFMNRINKRKVYENDSLQMYGVFKYRQFAALYTGKEDINSLIVRKILHEVGYKC
jgi:asparagine synthase (glutamine-hydrolysing)